MKAAGRNARATQVRGLPTTRSVAKVVNPLLRKAGPGGIKEYVESSTWLAGLFFETLAEVRHLRYYSREKYSEIDPGHGVLIRGQGASKGLAFVAITSKRSFFKSSTSALARAQRHEF